MAQNDVVVYWRPGCTYCMMLRAALRRTRLSYDEVNIRTEPAAAGYVRSVADGNETVPTVRIGDRALVNPTAGEVIDAVVEHDPAQASELRRPRISERWIAAVIVLALAIAFVLLVIW